MTDHLEQTHKVMAEALADPASIDPAALIGELMSANFRDYSNTNQALIESYQRQIVDLEAELGAIRVRINELFAGDYMPTESAIQQAVFFPRKALINSIKAQSGGAS